MVFPMNSQCDELEEPSPVSIHQLFKVNVIACTHGWMGTYSNKYICLAS